MSSHPQNDHFYDVVITGGGVAGCSAALALSRHSEETRVLLLEGGTYPRHKVCGEFFSSEGWTVLQRLGLDCELKERGAAPVHQARVLVGRRQTGAIPLPAPAWAISRWQLDDVLWRHATEICDTRDNVRVRRIAREDDGFIIETGEVTFRGRFVIDARGRAAKHLAGSPSPGARLRNSGTKFLGMKTHFKGARVPAGEVRLFPFRGGYCGVVMVEQQLVNACLLARYEGFDNPTALWHRALQENTALQNALRGAEQAMPWLTTANVTFGIMEPVFEGVLRCGDAAGYIQPFAGDGQAMAARSGELAAACIRAALRGGVHDDAAREMYQAAWRREFAARLNWGTRLQPLLLTPRAGEIAAHGLTIAPGIAGFLAGCTRRR